MRDTRQATIYMYQENLREQARQSGLIGEAITRHNQGRVQDAERMAAVTAQSAEAVTRLPNVPPQLITHLVKLDQRTQNNMVGNRPYQQNLTDARIMAKINARSCIGARPYHGLTDAR